MSSSSLLPHQKPSHTPPPQGTIQAAAPSKVVPRLRKGTGPPKAVTQRSTKRPRPVPQRPSATERIHQDWTKRARPSKAELRDHSKLIKYNRTYLGVDSAKADVTNGEFDLSTDTGVYFALQRLFGTEHSVPAPEWLSTLPTQSELQLGPMGRPSRHHSSTQTACFDTCLFNMLTSGYLDYYSFMALSAISPLITHFGRMIVKCSDYDFSWIAHEDPKWKGQNTVPPTHARAMLAALIFYRMHAPDVMRFLGGTYTGAYRFGQGAVATLQKYDIDPFLITQVSGALGYYFSLRTHLVPDCTVRQGHYSGLPKSLCR